MAGAGRRCFTFVAIASGLVLGWRPTSRHRTSLFRTAASRLWAMRWKGHVVDSVARADAAVVLAQDHVHDLMVGVSHPEGTARVCARPVSGVRLWGAGRDEDADVGRDPGAAAPFALDPDQTGRVAPLAVGFHLGNGLRGTVSVSLLLARALGQRRACRAEGSVSGAAGQGTGPSTMGAYPYQRD